MARQTPKNLCEGSFSSAVTFLWGTSYPFEHRPIHLFWGFSKSIYNSCKGPCRVAGDWPRKPLPCENPSLQSQPGTVNRRFFPPSYITDFSRGKKSIFVLPPRTSPAPTETLTSPWIHMYVFRCLYKGWRFGTNNTNSLYSQRICQSERAYLIPNWLHKDSHLCMRLTEGSRRTTNYAAVRLRTS